jgi:hypothetical protein
MVKQRVLKTLISLGTGHFLGGRRKAPELRGVSTTASGDFSALENTEEEKVLGINVELWNML